MLAKKAMSAHKPSHMAMPAKLRLASLEKPANHAFQRRAAQITLKQTIDDCSDDPSNYRKAPRYYARSKASGPAWFFLSWEQNEVGHILAVEIGNQGLDRQRASRENQPLKVPSGEGWGVCRPRPIHGPLTGNWQGRRRCAARLSVGRRGPLKIFTTGLQWSPLCVLSGPPVVLDRTPERA